MYTKSFIRTVGDAAQSVSEGIVKIISEHTSHLDKAVDELALQLSTLSKEVKQLQGRKVKRKVHNYVLLALGFLASKISVTIFSVAVTIGAFHFVFFMDFEMSLLENARREVVYSITNLVQEATPDNVSSEQIRDVVAREVERLQNRISSDRISEDQIREIVADESEKLWGAISSMRTSNEEHFARLADRLIQVGRQQAITTTRYVFANKEALDVEVQDVIGNYLEMGGYHVIFSVLSGRYYWAEGSADRIETAQGEGSSILEFALPDEFIRSLQIAHEIIAIGTASYKGNQKEEEIRSDERSRKLAEKMKCTLAPEQTLYTLSLGKYRLKPLSEETEYIQRPILLVAIIRRPDAIRLDEFMMELIKTFEVRSIDLGAYSRIRDERKINVIEYGASGSCD